MDVGNGVTGRVTCARGDRFSENFQRFAAPVHARVSDRQAKRWPAAETLRLLIECGRFIEAAHLAIERRQERLAIPKCRVELQRALAGCDRFVVQTEVTVKV